MQKERVVIIGSGPAGLAAALYTARAQLRPVVIVGNTLGGQAGVTHEIENYPGFPEGITGPDLIDNFRKQAERFGAQMAYDVVTEVDFSKGSPFTVKTRKETYVADAVIVAIGANPRQLGIPGEVEGIGYGVSYCGTCDGFFFRGKDVVVIGGGDSAVEEAIFLTKFANNVNIIHRREELRAGVALQTRARSNPKISFTWNTVVEEVLREESGKVRAVRLRDVNTNEVTEQATDGVFIFIGHDPNSAVFGGQLALDDDGYVIIDQLHRTNVEGVFAAGEIADRIYRQVATSVGQGTAAAMTAINWLQEHEAELQPIEDMVDLPQNTREAVSS